MLKKTIKYTDYNGVEQNEEFLFNLTKAELMEMELTTEGGLQEMIKRIIQAKDVPTIVKTFKEIILKSYGEKSADGKRFIKVNDAGVPLSRAFSQTEAYSNLFMELASDDKAASDFVIGIMPADIDLSEEEVQQALPENNN